MIKEERDLAIDNSVESIKYHVKILYKILNDNRILGSAIREHVGGVDDNINVLEGLIEELKDENK